MYRQKERKGLKPFKATGPDSIPAVILKAATDELAPIITWIYQTSLYTGQVPSDWRETWIFPVVKKEDKHNLSIGNPQPSFACYLDVV